MCRELFASPVTLAAPVTDDHFTYPDVLVTAHPADRAETRVVRHPGLIIEILSASTELRYRSWKVQPYQRLPDLQQYVLVSQKRILAESYTRTEHGTWKLRTLRQHTDSLVLTPLDLRVSLSTIYEEVELPPLPLADV